MADEQDQQQDQQQQDPQQQAFIDKDFNFREDWKESLPDGYKTSPYLARFTNFNDLVKSSVNAQKLIGLDKFDVVPLPNENSSEDLWNEYFTRIGRPDTKDGYEFEFPEGMKENEFTESYKELAHSIGLTPKQAKEVFGFYGNMVASQVKKTEELNAMEQEKGITALKEEWGMAFENKIEAANNAIRNLDPNGIIKKLGLDNNPDMARLMAHVGGKMLEDTLEKDDSQRGMTKNDALTEINRVMGDSSDPYHNGNHPLHDNAVSKMEELYRVAYSETPIDSVTSTPARERLLSA